MEAMVKFLNNSPDSYFWFFSSLAQSLATLIGLSGLFIVYRLQLQEKYISDKVKTLQRYLFEIIRGADFSSMTRDDIIDAADSEIQYHERLIGEHNGALNSIENQIEREEGNAGLLSNKKAELLSLIRTEEVLVTKIALRKAEIIESERYKKRIQVLALITITYFIFLFIISVLGIIHKFTNIGILVVSLFLLIGLIFLFICCAVSLDYGRPALKDSFKKLVSYIKSLLQKEIC